MQCRVVLAALAAAVLAAAPAQSGWHLDVETGAAFSGYNDVRVPGNEGTDISLSQELEADPAAFGRIRVTRDLGGRHHLSLLAAPLRLKAGGSVNREILFAGRSFPAGVRIDARYRFDSYRLTYRYDLVTRAKVQFGLGLTAKVRDASISLTGNGQTAEKTNTGFVPLVNFLLRWQFDRRLALLVDGDALAAPQGRAEDVLVALAAGVSERFQIKLGYRILEGGADNDEVYTFALVDYAVAGLLWEMPW